MSVEFPDDIEAFVKEEVARGAAADVGDFLAKAVELYRELKSGQDVLRADVHKSIGQAERGEVAPLDTQATKAEARRRFLQQ
jgi:Arc/MetJ-type ribon-helix-helix transcriptional regulator